MGDTQGNSHSERVQATRDRAIIEYVMRKRFKVGKRDTRAARRCNSNKTIGVTQCFG